MKEKEIKTLKEVSHICIRPAHRIIHLCETGVVRPAVDAAGRGSVRRFSRDDIFYLLLALDLQDAGVEVPLIKPLIEALHKLMRISEIKKLVEKYGLPDLVGVINHIGSIDDPVLVFLTPPARVALVTPKFSVPIGPGIGVELHRKIDRHFWHRGVSIVANLTDLAERLRRW